MAARGAVPLVTMTDDAVILDRDKLLSIAPEQMYKWHYEIVEAARESRT